MAKRLIFPITGWVTDLSELPMVSEDEIQAYCSCHSSTQRPLRRSYNFHVEAFVIAARSRANYIQKARGVLFVRCSCYRSKKKTSHPYVITAAVDVGDAILDSNCGCPAGAGCFNQFLAVLRTLAMLQKKGYSEVPDHLSCIDLPQQWRVPRNIQISGTSVHSVNRKGVYEGSSESTITARLYDCRAAPRNASLQEAVILRFAQGLFDSDGSDMVK